MNATILSISAIMLPLLGAGIGYLVKQTLEKKKELVNEVNKERRELYQKFVDLIIDLFNNTKKGQNKLDPTSITKLYEFYKKYILFASPRVINAFSDHFQYLYHLSDNEEKQDSKKQFRLLTKVMAEMRKDLGLKNKKLGRDGEKLLRAMIVDFDDVMK